MYKIGEFSKITNLSIKALRYYDKEGILNPAKREDENSYRLYGDENFKKASLIKKLRDLQFSISEIKDVLLICQDDYDLSFILEQKKEIIEKEIYLKQELINKIEASINHSVKEKIIMNYEIQIKEIDEVKVAAIRYQGQYDECGEYMGKIFKAARGNAIGKAFNLYYDEGFREVADIEVCVPVKHNVDGDSITCKTLSRIKAITTIHKGSYDSLGNAYKALFDYATENKIKVVASSREIYLKGPGMIFAGNPDKYETEIILPIEG